MGSLRHASTKNYTPNSPIDKNNVNQCLVWTVSLLKYFSPLVADTTMSRHVAAAGNGIINLIHIKIHKMICAVAVILFFFNECQLEVGDTTLCLLRSFYLKTCSYERDNEA